MLELLIFLLIIIIWFRVSEYLINREKMTPREYRITATVIVFIVAAIYVLL